MSYQDHQVRGSFNKTAHILASVVKVVVSLGGVLTGDQHHGVKNGHWHDSYYTVTVHGNKNDAEKDNQ